MINNVRIPDFVQLATEIMPTVTNEDKSSRVGYIAADFTRIKYNKVSD